MRISILDLMPNDATFYVTDEKGEALPILLPIFVVKLTRVLLEDNCGNRKEYVF